MYMKLICTVYGPSLVVVFRYRGFDKALKFTKIKLDVNVLFLFPLVGTLPHCPDHSIVIEASFE